MKKTVAFATAVLGAVAITGVMTASDEAVAADKEKCYGVAKAGANDCGTKSHSCAGQAKMDNQADEWIFVPKGLCERLAGGSLEPK